MYSIYVASCSCITCACQCKRMAFFLTKIHKWFYSYPCFFETPPHSYLRKVKQIMVYPKVHKTKQKTPITHLCPINWRIEATLHHIKYINWTKKRAVLAPECQMHLSVWVGGWLVKENHKCFPYIYIYTGVLT